MAKTSQTFLLVDHIKLSLLERRQANVLDFDSGIYDGHISRSLEQLRNGLASLRQEKLSLEQAGDISAADSISTEIATLEKQYDVLKAQFSDLSEPSTEFTLEYANLESPAINFTHTAPIPRKLKTVRFTDSSSPPSDALFHPYEDDPMDTSSGLRDQAGGMNNQQLYEYHSQILDAQDVQLDRLGESISRQRELSLQIGDELDTHVAMLDEVEVVTDRHQSRLDRAMKALKTVARGGDENKQMAIIVIIVMALILLIVILK
ncbi:hypothetical protein CDD83_3512 [Cordyceps sp. RAO-2017]|nr:hypothetical protein CDD83_3512 [Cordyceps sp. RAO-2017]